MLYLHQLKIKDNKHPIAHEVVFPEHTKRNYINSFRFVFMSLTYHLDTNISQVCKELGYDKNRVYRNFVLVQRSSKWIDKELLEAVFQHLNFDYHAISLIAKHFELSECNAISFSEDYTVFFNAVKVNLSPTVNDYLKSGGEY